MLLALRALKLGDLLVAVPALRGLPGVSRAPDFVRRAGLDRRGFRAGGRHSPPATPGLDDPLAVPRGTVDIAVNLHGNGPESRLRIEELQANRVMAHESPRIGGPAWITGIPERERWTRLLGWHGIDADPLDYRLNCPAVPSPRPGATVIHVGAAYGSRLWPVERFADVAVHLAAAGHQVVLTGGTSERVRAEETAALAKLNGANLDDGLLAGRQGLAEFAATIAGARLVVSADTGAAHLASAYERPSVVLFGPAPAEEWGPPPGRTWCLPPSNSAAVTCSPPILIRHFWPSASATFWTPWSSWAASGPWLPSCQGPSRPQVGRFVQQLGLEGHQDLRELARYLHLRHPQGFGDGGLRFLAVVAPVQQVAVLRAQFQDDVAQSQHVLEPVSRAAEGGKGALQAVPAIGCRGVQGIRALAGSGHERLAHLAWFQIQILGNFLREGVRCRFGLTPPSAPALGAGRLGWSSADGQPSNGRGGIV